MVINKLEEREGQRRNPTPFAYESHTCIHYSTKLVKTFFSSNKLKFCSNMYSNHFWGLFSRFIGSCFQPSKNHLVWRVIIFILAHLPHILLSIFYPMLPASGTHEPNRPFSPKPHGRNINTAQYVRLECVIVSPPSVFIASPILEPKTTA